MDQLKGERGFTLIEVLVSMVILGVLVTLTVLFINTFFNNPVTFFRAEALNAAKSELNYATALKIETDSAFTALNGNLSVERKVDVGEILTTVTITVLHIPTGKELIELSKIYRNE